MHFVESPVSLDPATGAQIEQWIPFLNGEVSVLVPTTSDVHADIPIAQLEPPAGVLQEILENRGRSAAYSADFETAWDPGFGPIVRDTVRYVAPDGSEPVADVMRCPGSSRCPRPARSSSSTSVPGSKGATIRCRCWNGSSRPASWWRRAPSRACTTRGGPASATRQCLLEDAMGRMRGVLGL